MFWVLGLKKRMIFTGVREIKDSTYRKKKTKDLHDWFRMDDEDIADKKKSCTLNF